MILVFQSNKGSVLGNFKSYSCFPIQYYLDKKKKLWNKDSCYCAESGSILVYFKVIMVVFLVLHTASSDIIF